MQSTISFELHTNMAEEIDLKVQFSELQKLSDLDLDLGSGQGHTGAHIRVLPTHRIRSKSKKNLFVDA